MSTHERTKNAAAAANADYVPITEAKRLVGALMLATIANPERTQDIPPMYLHSSPGIGKSSVIRQVAEEYGLIFRDFRMSQCEPVDIGGMRVPDASRTKMIRLFNEEFPSDPKARGIILFDEMSAADKSLQAAAYEITLERRCGMNYQVPKGIYICAAGNTMEDGAIANPISSALANRFCHLEVGPDSNATIAYFSSRGGGQEKMLKATSPEERQAHLAQQVSRFHIDHGQVHPDVIAYLRTNEHQVSKMDAGNPERGWPSPRSWDRVSMISLLKDARAISEGDERMLVNGLIGQGPATTYLAYRQTAAQLPSAWKLLTDPAEADKFEAPKKADERWAVVQNVIFQMYRSSEPAVLDSMTKNYCKVLNKMPDDLSVVMMTDTIAKIGYSDDLVKRVAKEPSFSAWCAKALPAMNRAGIKPEDIFKKQTRP